MKSIAAREEKAERGGRGEAPRDAEWPLVALAEVVDFIRGVTFDKTDAKYRPVDGHVPILRAGNIGNGLTLDDDLVWVPPARVDEDQMLRVGDLAICMSSGSPAVVGKTAQLREPWRGSVGAFCGIIRPRPHVHPDFVALWFRAGAFREWRDGQSRGANIQNLRFSQFAALEIPLPPLAEQERIAGRLTEQLAAVERARGAAQSRLAAAESLPAAYRREVFEGPEASGWERPTIDDIAEVQGGYAFKSDWFTDGGVRILRNANIHQGFIAWDDVVFVSADLARELPSLVLAEGDIVLTLDRPIVAGGLKAARLGTGDLPALLNQRVARFNLDANRIDADYFYMFLRSKAFIGGLPKHDHSLGVPHVSPGQVGEIAVPLPPLPDQRRIAADLAARLAGAERLAVGVRAELAAIQTLPAALLREAFAPPPDPEGEEGA